MGSLVHRTGVPILFPSEWTLERAGFGNLIGLGEAEVSA
jgi:hypothetical protein